ncbi:MAG TPA: SPASM domain-containing protein [Candidatus Lokiarchaeia archaeon]
MYNINHPYLEYRKNWEAYPKKHIQTRTPLHVDIELNTNCNLQCEICPYHSPNALYKPETSENMDFQLYKKIISEIAEKDTKSIKLNYRGEPLLYKYLPEAIYYAKSHKIINVQLNSNALLLTPELVTRLIYSRLDEIIITDYNIDKQVENAKLLIELRKELGFENPLITIQSFERIKWLNKCDKISDPIYYNYNTIDEVFDKSEFECEQPWLRFVVLADGTVMSCSCGIVIVDKILGNVRNFTIEQLWNSVRMKFIRTCYEGHSTELLRQCRMCPARNDFILKNKK